MAAAILLGTATAAAAHSVLLETAPAGSATVRSAPSDIVLTFNEMPRQRFSTVHVFGPDGARRDSGSVRVVNDSVHQALGGTRPAGTYTVDWRVISADGHPASGQFTYAATADAASLAVVQEAANPTSGDTKSGGSTILIVVLVVAAIAVLVAGLLVLRRRRRRLRMSPSRPARAGTSAAGGTFKEDDEDDS